MADITETKSERQAERLEQQWFVVGRWQEYEGEARANLLRILAIGAFYGVELYNYYVAGEVSERFHQIATLLAAAWAMLSLATLYCLKARVFPPLLKFVTTGADLAFLTGLLVVADGPRSPLVVGYFLVITLAALRLQRRLISCATIGSLAGYLALLGYAKWYAGERSLTVPRYQQLIVLVALALMGVILGQVIGRVKALAEDFARRAENGR